MSFIVRNASAVAPFQLKDDFIDVTLAPSEHADLELIFAEDQLYLSSVSPYALYTAITDGNIIRRTEADDADIAAAYAFDDALWRWSPTRGQKEALSGTVGTPSSTNKYVTFEDPRYHASTHLTSGSDALAVGTPVSVGVTNTQGSAASFALSDHVHQGVHSFKATAGGTARYGDITLIEGSGVTLTDNSGEITIAASGIGVPYGTTTVTLVPDAVMTAGSSSAVSRADHGHAIAASAPVTSLSASTVNTEGSSTDFARADHIHAILTGIAANLTPDQTSASGTSASLARADHVHNIPAAAPVSIGTANSKGTAASFALSDHVHNLALSDGLTFTSESLGVTYGLPVTQAPDQTNASGSATTAARSDHVHNIPADTAVTLNANSTSTEGSSTSFGRADHTHAIASGIAVTQTPNQTNASGTSVNFARADHVHNIPAGLPVSISTTNTSGSEASFALSDHTHQGLHSVTLLSGTTRYGDVVLVQGAGISITDTNGSYTFAASISGFGLPVTLNPDQTNASGSAATAARSDHVHNVPADTAVSLNAASTSTEGSSTSFGRADHTHAIASDIAVTLTPDQTNASGTSTSFARADHVHNVPTGIAVSVGATNASGSAASFSRSDHVHQGVHSITLLSGTARYNDVTLVQGSGITITDTNGSYSIAANTATGTGLKIKAGIVTSGSFSGNPKKATVTFTSAFSSTAYAITITGTDARTWSYESKAAGSFVINSNANTALTGEVSWHAIQSGESN